MKIPTLDAKINKLILSLESCYPDNNKDIWVTITEMRDRLVHSGVHSSLSLELVKTALTRCNKGGIFMAKRSDGRTSFYRHSLLTHDVGSPSDQERSYLDILNAYKSILIEIILKLILMLVESWM